MPSTDPSTLETRVLEVERADIELLGQRVNYPRTWQGVAVIITITVLIIWVTFIALVQSRPENLQTLGLITGQLQIDTQEQKVERQKWFRFEFWTPSEKTGQNLANYLSKHPEQADEYRWQIHDEKTNNIREKNHRFGTRLINDSAIDGYRRYPVSGDGRSGFKEGWWWVVGVKGDYSEAFFKWFAETYKEHWGVPMSSTSHVEITALTSSK